MDGGWGVVNRAAVPAQMHRSANPATLAAMPPADLPAKPARAAAEAVRHVAAGAPLAAHLASGRLHGVYLVTSAEVEDRARGDDRPGADPQALLAVARAIEAAALIGGDAALDLVKVDYLDGDHQGGGIHALVAQEARSMSLFGGRRVITILHADALTFADAASDDAPKIKGKRRGPVGVDPLEALVTLLDPVAGKPPFVLIFVAEHFDRRKKAFKTLAQAGILVDVAPLTEASLQAYLEAEAAPFGISVEPRVASKIKERLGEGDASRLRQTADRLLLDAGPRGVLTVRMVETSVPMDREAAIWAITDAIADEDVTRALTVLHLMLDPATASEREGENLRIIGFLNSNYTAMMHLASAWARNKPDAQIVEELGMNPWRLKNLARQLRTMRAGRLELALAAVDAADHVLKSTAIGERKVATTRWMEQLVVALARGTPLRLRPAPAILGAL